ncbi:MAG: putative polymerase sigma factor [Actinomycetia bacterium]|nr:putative polymerase sigma factor [Actinomycetes bacterium]
MGEIALAIRPPLNAAVFCAELQPRLVGSLVLFTGDRLLGEELAQEALVRALERWDNVNRLDCPEAWVFRVGFNLAKSARRRRTCERQATRRLAARAVENAELPDTPTSVTVRAAVSSLPPGQRAVIIARFFAGLDVKTTAAALGCADGTVKAHTHQAMAGLRASSLIEHEQHEQHEQEVGGQNRRSSSR